ncbi:trypsin-like peptidase domain-containing protein [Zobellella maritima]|uniref:trypsin-like peptidase domain-containing protein n=1 Tax=Zobellella maritima TaxID=2059725 RepID=UPI0018E56C37|nr:trypsin-like peptidase domain-containing protein [Zobellella maritima]
MDKIRLLFALFSMFLGGCNLTSDAQYQTAYEAELQGDDTRAFRYYLRAAENNGYPEAQYSVANMYLEGRGTRQDTGQAISWFKRVADGGDPVWSPLGHLQLGSIYRGDYGERYRDREQAAEHYRACAEQGDEECARLLTLLGRPPSLSPPAVSPAIPALGGEPPAGSEAVELYARREPSVYKIVVYERLGAGLEPISLGSAIAIDPYRAVTNYHLVKAGGVPVSINTRGEYVREGDVLVWRVVKTDPRRDLALLELIESNRQLEFTDAIKPFSQVRVGEKVFAIGSPAGLEKTLTEGIVSALRNERGVRLIQTTAPITYGSSGGALFDAEGQLIGVTTKGIQAGGNFNFAIAVDEVQAFLAE